ncbi:MAG: hypothetical protein KF716_07170 [Anaerolineae bacterium]|nr:hypothetical protein [Anaerolineae bacterium]
MRRSSVLFIITAIILAAMVLLLSMDMLPAAPTSPTPTWPMGIDLPEKLPRIPR